ncbi:MAG: ATP-dependent DNA ligase [Nitriliruptoraceae bacterium]
MNLPVSAPVDPMLARLARSLPTGELLYEPKWDGFRCLVFRDGDDLLLQSRNSKALDRYFPELVDPDGPDPLRSQLPERVVLDGEIVVPIDGRLDFDALANRVHPARSRIHRLAAETPARYVAFDLLALGDEDLTAVAFSQRRQRLEQALVGVHSPVHVTPATTDVDVALDWFERFEGAGFDGVIAKPLGDGYAPGRRTLFKVKHERTADVVVAGFRWHRDGDGVGSLLLGLFDGDTLVPVGVASSFSRARRAELIDELAPMRLDDVSAHPWNTDAAPRGANRWTGGRDTSWEPLDCEQVAEVAYEQLTGNRFRHSARWRRWRDDRDPRSCRFDQLDVPVPSEIDQVFAEG